MLSSGWVCSPAVFAAALLYLTASLTSPDILVAVLEQSVSLFAACEDLAEPFIDMVDSFAAASMADSAGLSATLEESTLGSYLVSDSGLSVEAVGEALKASLKEELASATLEALSTDLASAITNKEG